MEISKKKTNPNFEKKTSNVLKADCTIHRVTFNPITASPVQALRVPVPKFDGGVVHLPGSLSLIFDLAVSVPAKNYIVKNVARGLVDKLTEKFAGEIAQNTDGYDLLKLHEDLLFTEENDRASMFREGIQSVIQGNLMIQLFPIFVFINIIELILHVNS